MNTLWQIIDYGLKLHIVKGTAPIKAGYIRIDIGSVSNVRWIVTNSIIVLKFVIVSHIVENVQNSENASAFVE